MSFDRSLARCSFCGRRPPEVRRMVAGPGAAYICDTCLELCNEILDDPTPFSTKALELASRPPIVIAAPQQVEHDIPPLPPREPLRTIKLEFEQKQQGMTLMLYQVQFYQKHFELHYLWIRPSFTPGFAFVPRIIFLVKDNTGSRWTGDRGGTLMMRPELSSETGTTQTRFYQGSVRFQPLPSTDARVLSVSAADPLAPFEDPA